MFLFHNSMQYQYFFMLFYGNICSCSVYTRFYALKVDNPNGQYKSFTLIVTGFSNSFFHCFR